VSKTIPQSFATIIELNEDEDEGEAGFRDLLWDLVDAGLRVQLGWSRTREGGMYDLMQPEQSDSAIWRAITD
jgi:hypothetical protein